MRALPSPLSSRGDDLPAASWARNDTAKIAIDAGPGGPTAKRQPSPEGLGNRSRRESERRGRGTKPIVRSPCVIRSVPGFPTSPLSPATTYVVLPKENHMQLTEAPTLDRKSGGSRRSCSSADLSWKCFSTERSVVERSAVLFPVLTHRLKANPSDG
jgi:hypothetical protein